MSFNNLEVGNSHGKFRVCPICGKDHYCSTYPDRSGQYEFISCKFIIDRINLQGNDGKFYIYTGDTEGGNARYEEAHQNLARLGDSQNTNKGSFDHFIKNQEKNKELYASTKIEKIKPLPDSQLNKIYSTLLDNLILEDYHKEQLLADGWTEEEIKRSRVKSFPKPDFMAFKENSRNPKRFELGSILEKAYGDLTGVPGAYLKQARGKSTYYWTFAGAHGMVFPCFNQIGEVRRLRIRLDEPLKNANGKVTAKYLNLSSFKLNKEKTANKYKNGTESGSSISFYNYNCFSEADYYICKVTEGEKKGIIGNSRLGVPIVSLPGVNCIAMLLEVDPATGMNMIEYLISKGCKVLIIAYDADKNVNNKVLYQEQKLINELLKYDIIIGVANWEAALGKGLDDLALNGFKPTYSVAEYKDLKALAEQFKEEEKLNC